jgi:hypothetical protein
VRCLTPVCAATAIAGTAGGLGKVLFTDGQCTVRSSFQSLFGINIFGDPCNKVCGGGWVTCHATAHPRCLMLRGSQTQQLSRWLSSEYEGNTKQHPEAHCLCVLSSAVCITCTAPAGADAFLTGCAPAEQLPCFHGAHVHHIQCQYPGRVPTLRAPPPPVSQVAPSTAPTISPAWTCGLVVDGQSNCSGGSGTGTCRRAMPAMHWGYQPLGVLHASLHAHARHVELQ